LRFDSVSFFHGSLKPFSTNVRVLAFFCLGFVSAGKLLVRCRRRQRIRVRRHRHCRSATRINATNRKCFCSGIFTCMVGPVLTRKSGRSLAGKAKEDIADEEYEGKQGRALVNTGTNNLKKRIAGIGRAAQTHLMGVSPGACNAVAVESLEMEYKCPPVSSCDDGQ
jgi:hypothetical protein